MLDLSDHPQGTVLPVKARAGGRTNGVTGIRDGALLVSVTEVAEKGKANRAIVSVLAEALGCSKRQLELIKGSTSPTKRFLVAGIRRDELQQRLFALLDR